MSSGLYLHYPFCKKKCSYCDFTSTTDLEFRKGYFAYLIKEYSFYARNWPGDIFDTIYIGGGTPSLMPDEDWDIFANWKNRYFSNILELTVEANPESVSSFFLHNFKNASCNRLSLGIQSMDDVCLSLSGRIHTSEEAIRSIELVQASQILNLNLDFILGLPGESEKTIEKNIKLIERVRPQHISLYFLSYPDHSGILTMQKNNPSLFPNETKLLERWQQYLLFFSKMGYEHYEISNFAQPGFASRHNSHYWRFDTYLGLGVSSSSYDQSNRWTNSHLLQTYIEKIIQGIRPVDFIETLSSETKHFERIMLGLRNLNTGIPLDWIMKEKESSLRELLSLEWIQLQDSFVYVTEKGCIWLDTIIKKLA